MDENGILVEESELDGQFLEKRRMHSLELDGDRVISLGLSIYDLQIPREVKGEAGLTKIDSLPEMVEGPENSCSDFRDSFTAVAGLDFCSALLGGNDEMPQIRKRQCFPLENIDESPSVKQYIHRDSTQTIRIDARLNRADSKSALIEISKKFDQSASPEDAKPLHHRSSVSELMQKIIIDEN